MSRRSRASARPVREGLDRAHERRQGAWARPGYACAAILIAGAIAYANSLRGPLIFDDHRTLRINESIRQIGTSLHPPTQTAVTGRPIANLTFAVNYAFSDLDTTSYHV